jgi:hypothetical protein
VDVSTQASAVSCVRRHAAISLLVRRVLGLSSNDERVRASDGRALEVELLWSSDLLLARSFPRPTAERRSVGRVWMSGACCVWFRVRRVSTRLAEGGISLWCSSSVCEDVDDTYCHKRESLYLPPSSCLHHLHAPRLWLHTPAARSSREMEN